MASNSPPKLDLQWLKDNAVSITKNKWYLLEDHRIAVFVDGKVKFTGRWEDESILVMEKKNSRTRKSEILELADSINNLAKKAHHTDAGTMQ